jgi:hypothetical protein
MHYPVLEYQVKESLEKRRLFQINWNKGQYLLFEDGTVLIRSSRDTL